MDMEFEETVEKFDLVEANTSAARGHIGKIEHGICVINEHGQYVITSLPFSHYHK